MSGSPAHNQPTGFGTVTPYLVADAPEALADFLKTVFDAVEIGRTQRPGGPIANMQLRIGTVTLMLSQSTAKLPAMACAWYVYVDDAEALMQRALDAGATEILAVADMDYGDRQGGVQDAWGHIWWISQRLDSAPYHP